MLFLIVALFASLVLAYPMASVSYQLNTRIASGLGFLPIYALAIFGTLCAVYALILVLRTRQALSEQGTRVDPLPTGPRPTPTRRQHEEPDTGTPQGRTWLDEPLRRDPGPDPTSSLLEEIDMPSFLRRRSCPNCNTRIERGGSFCGNCGTAMNPQDAATS